MALGCMYTAITSFSSNDIFKFHQHIVKVSDITEKNTATVEDIANLLRIGQSKW